MSASPSATSVAQAPVPRSKSAAAKTVGAVATVAAAVVAEKIVDASAAVKPALVKDPKEPRSRPVKVSTVKADADKAAEASQEKKKRKANRFKKDDPKAYLDPMATNRVISLKQGSVETLLKKLALERASSDQSEARLNNIKKLERDLYLQKAALDSLRENREGIAKSLELAAQLSASSCAEVRAMGQYIVEQMNIRSADAKGSEEEDAEADE